MWGVILFLAPKTAHHTWLTKLWNNALACLRWLWLRRLVVSRPPPHYSDTEGLLHNLRHGCFASFIKGIRLGRPDYFLAISYTTEHKAQNHSVWNTLHMLDFSREKTTSEWARILNLPNIIVIQCPSVWKKNHLPSPHYQFNFKMENRTNLNAIMTFTYRGDVSNNIIHSPLWETCWEKKKLHI